MNEPAHFYSGKKVLVTGGTGFTGSVLVKKLCQAGARVSLIQRSERLPEALRGLSLRCFHGDVFDEQTINDAIADVEYVFHVAAAFREAKIEDHVYWDVHLKSTKLLAAAALKQSNFKRFIHVSTVGVLGHIANGLADENTPYHPGDVYQDSKAAAEQWLLAFSEQKHLPITVIRPAAIYGPGDKRLLKLFKMARLPVIPLLGFGRGDYHLVHVDDLTEMMLLAGAKEKAAGEVLICGSSKATSIKEIISIVSESLGHRARFIRLPAQPIFALAYLCEFVSKKIGVEPILYPRRVAFFTKDRRFNTQKVHALLNYTDRFTNKTGLEQTLRWYRENQWL
jgi:nucleoside-diphosphate-sugar epimerase